MSALSIAGTRKSGQVVRDENATAVLAMANIVRSSLGPAGLDKMIVDDVGEVNITNDGATMLKLIEVEHPAAKILVELAQLQDQEVGDGTTSVVILAAELVRRGNELIKSSIHPTTVISGYQQARKAACKFIAENLSFKVDELGVEGLRGVAKTTMSSKSIGVAAEHFASLAVEAIQCIGRPQAKGAPKGAPAITYSVKDVGIIKLRGDSLADSEILDGVAIERNRSLASFGFENLNIIRI